MGSPMDEEGSRRARIVAALVAALSVVPFWTCPVVPTQDGPAHLYNAWLLVHFDDPVMQASRFFRLNLLVPNWGGIGPLVPLLLAAPAPIAEKLLFSAIAFLLVGGAAALAARLGGDPILAAAVAISVAHGWLVAMGFTGFVLGLGLGLVLCAWLAGRPPGPVADTVTALGLTAGLVLLLVLHLAAALLIAPVAALLLAARWGPRGEPLPSARLLAPFVVLAVLVGGHLVSGLGRAAPPYRSDPRGVLGRLVELPQGTYWEAYSESDRGLGTGVMVLVCGLVLARATSKIPAPRPARVLLIATPAVLVAYLAVPFASGGGAYLTDRLVPLLLLLPLPWATSRGLPRRGPLRATALLLAAAMLAQRGAQYRAWGRVAANLVEANRGVAPGALLIQPPWPTSPSTGVDPLAHLWGRVAIETRAVPLDDYEAALAGFFPVSYTAEGLALSAAWTSRGVVPAGAAAVRRP